MIKRNEKVAFMDIGTGGADFHRMTGFTEFIVSKNPKEYSRKYIDEAAERSSVVGYAPSVSYKIDLENGNKVHEIFVSVANEELIGEDAVRSFIIADISLANEDGICPAICREFSIIPGSEGDDTDLYTMNGTLKASGDKISGTATSTDGWKTVTFTPAE